MGLSNPNLTGIAGPQSVTTGWGGPTSLNIPGTGPNNSATNFNVVTNNGVPGIWDGANWFPIFSQSQITGQGTIQGNPSLLAAFGNDPSVSGVTGGYTAAGTTIPGRTQKTPSGGTINVAPSTAKGNISVSEQNRGGGSTLGNYSLVNGWYVPTSLQGVGQPSWWQSTGIPLAVISAITAGAGMAAAGGAGAAETAGAAGTGAAGTGAAGTGLLDVSAGQAALGSQALADSSSGLAGLTAGAGSVPIDVAGAAGAAGAGAGAAGAAGAGAGAAGTGAASSPWARVLGGLAGNAIAGAVRGNGNQTGSNVTTPAGFSSGATGTPMNIGYGTVPSPARGSLGALGGVPYQQPNPWANHLLNTPPPVNPNDPSANLFRSFNPGLITAPPAGPTASGAGSTGPVNPSGPGMMGGPAQTGSAPMMHQGPALRPQVGGGTLTMPGGGATAPDNPFGGWGPSGNPFGGAGPTRTQQGPFGWQIGGVNRPSALLAASNPASGQPQGWWNSLPQNRGPTLGGMPLPPAGSVPMVNLNPSQIDYSRLPVMAHGGHFADGGPSWASLSSGSAPSPTAADNLDFSTYASPLAAAAAPPATGATGDSRMHFLQQLLSHNPMRGPRASSGDPTLDELMQSQYGGGGGPNSAMSVLAQLGVPMHTNLRRVGQPNFGYAEGGSPLGAATLPSAGSRHVAGPSGGQDDSVNAKLSDGEYVLDADTVSNLGDGNNEAGARKLDEFRNNIRAHKRNGPKDDIPPKAKPVEKYMPKGKKSAAKKSAEAALATGRR